MLRCLVRSPSLASRSVLAVRSYSSDLSNYRATNEPVLNYVKGSQERKELENTVNQYVNSEPREIPIVIGDEVITYKDSPKFQVSPFDHKHKIARYYYASQSDITRAIDSNLKARAKWERTPWEERANIFLKAADLMAGKYRPHLLATTMLGQAKTIYQAEIDAAVELIDFLRFNVDNMAKLVQYEPISTKLAKNSMRYRGMEGFWAAISPFNFTAIGGNLPASPAFAGNTVIWKPTDTALLSNYLIYTILREAGLPPGVINFVPADGPTFGQIISKHPELAGINFTGSVPTFRYLYKAVGENIDNYNYFPRLIGECGGKNYHLLHESADIDNAVNGTIRSGFEYSGQKCSACSRVYVPDKLWDDFMGKLVKETKKLQFGSPLEYDKTYASAVIDKKAFDRLKQAIDSHAKGDSGNRVLVGGTYDESKGYYIHPTVVETSDPGSYLMKTELFGPVLTAYKYNSSDPLEKVIDAVNSTTKYALTGAIFGQDSEFLQKATEALKFSAGNFYINVQSTGSVVGQQPFGGARLSGTNDKAGGPHYLLRFMSPQATKQGIEPVKTYHAPHVIA